MSFSTKIVAGLVLGIVVGLFFGEMVAFFHVVANAYIQLLQMTVLPYVIISLITGIGSLTYRQAKMLLIKVGGILLLLWLVSLVMVFLMPLAFPRWESASFFSTSLVQQKPSFDFLNLYIPANPFYSMANNIVPAVVLFSVIVGVALIGVEKKERFIDTLNVFNRALTRATHFVVKLTPIGIFAIAASHAGTMKLSEFERLQVYMLVYIAMGVLLTFWVLPGLVASLTSIRHRELIGLTKDALITAFMTGNLFIVLPILSDASKGLLAKHSINSEESQSLPEVIVPASFNFPHAGKVLTLSFVLFAGWFSDSVVDFAAYPKLAATGVMSLFGNLAVSIPFLLDLFEVPADMFELFLVTSVVNSRVGTLIAAMNTMVIALLGTCAIVGGISFDSRRLLRYAGITAVLTFVTIAGARVVFSGTLENRYEKDKILSGMHLLRNPLPATVHKMPPPFDPSSVDKNKSVLSTIRERGLIRVGYRERGLPYAYFNSAGELVGFDVEMAHRLAKEMDVGLEFVPIDLENLSQKLNEGHYDIVMCGTVITTERAEEMTFSTPYLNETLALVVKDHRRHQFVDWEEIKHMGSFQIGVPNLPYYLNMVRTHLPKAEVSVIDDVVEFFEGNMPHLDAILFTAERGSAWSLFYPKYSVTVPGPGRVGVPLAYLVGRRDLEMARFVSTWIELKKNDGTIKELFDYWIKGNNATKQTPRWSVIRDVLHWVD
jgi:Na+/H+-dicarboxylate symporter